MKKTPMRMCVACREMKPKASLIRAVRDGDSAARDDTGKAKGRGAYVCKNAACIKKAQKIRGFERALSAQCDTAFYLDMEGYE